jgi:hypothetical protein
MFPEAKNEAIDSLVNVYSSGIFDETEAEKIKEFPINEAKYIGNVYEANKASELEKISFEPERRGIDYVDKFPSKLEEYPKIETPFIGNIYELNQNEAMSLPMEIETKNIGYYEHLPASKIEEEEKKPGALEKLTKLFKGSKTTEGYPIDTEPFTGHIANTNLIPEAKIEPIHSFVSIYSSGRSDELPTITKLSEYLFNETPYVENIFEANKVSELNQLPMEVEKKNIGYYDQLPSLKTEALFVGNISEAIKQSELLPKPLEVEAKHIGYYETLPSIYNEKKPGALEKLTKLFKGSKTSLDYPVDFEAYSGPIKNTEIVSEAKKEPINSLVNVYSSGRSDEIPKLSEFPINEAKYIGNVYEAKPETEANSLPLEIERKDIGFYEYLPITTSVEEEKKPGAIEKLTHLFKHVESRDSYPQVSGSTLN